MLEFIPNINLIVFIIFTGGPLVEDMIKKCGNRFVGFTNHPTKRNSEQIQALYDVISKVQNKPELFHYEIPYKEVQIVKKITGKIMETVGTFDSDNEESTSITDSFFFREDLNAKEEMEKLKNKNLKLEIEKTRREEEEKKKAKKREKEMKALKLELETIKEEVKRNNEMQRKEEIRAMKFRRDRDSEDLKAYNCVVL